MKNDGKTDFQLEDCHYMVYGSGKVTDKYGVAGIVFSTDRFIVRAKFTGSDADDMSPPVVQMNNRSYTMTKYQTGKYKGYYGVILGNILDSDQFNILLQASSKSGRQLERVVGFGRVLIDPSGIITGSDGEPIEGVKVTLEKLQEDNTTWVKWDAENYLQCNPVYTNAEGRYGWDVTEGTYRIVAEKEGYKTTIIEKYYSRDQGEETAITVLPPRFDVDFTMEYADPENPPTKPMTFEQAKVAIASALSDATFIASADETDVTARALTALTNNMYVSFKEGTYLKTDSAVGVPGKIEGTLLLENTYTDETTEVPVSVLLNEPSSETLEPTEEFADKLLIEKFPGDDGAVRLVVSAKGSTELPQLILYRAFYGKDQKLLNAGIQKCERSGNKFELTIARPSTADGTSYQLMLWTDGQCPIIAPITNVTEGFFKN